MGEYSISSDEMAEVRARLSRDIMAATDRMGGRPADVWYVSETVYSILCAGANWPTDDLLLCGVSIRPATELRGGVWQTFVRRQPMGQGGRR